MWFVSMLHCWAAPMQRQRYGKNSKKRVVMGVKKSGRDLLGSDLILMYEVLMD